jgi:hypothetical protein
VLALFLIPFEHSRAQPAQADVVAHAFAGVEYARRANVSRDLYGGRRLDDGRWSEAEGRDAMLEAIERSLR